MYKVKNFFNKRNGFLAIMILTTFLVCVVNASYAFFTATAERKGALNIVSGNLYSLISSGDLNDEKQITVKGNSKETIDVKLTNVNGIDAKFNFYYIASDETVEVGYTKSGDACPDRDGVVLPKNGDEGDSKSFVVQITNNSESAVTVTFGSKVGLSNQTLDFPSEGHVLPMIVCKNTTDKVNGLPVNSCEDVDYNDESANKNAMFEIEHPDGTTGYRYIGDDPYNYVQIDGESSKWRIIGVFNDPDSTGEDSKKRIKLIRDESVGNYSWDNKPKGTGSNKNSNYGSNDWSDATLNTILNSGAYWSKQNGICSSEISPSKLATGSTKACDFSITGLSPTLKNMIEKMKWYLGGYDKLSEPHSTEKFFTQERGDKGGVNGTASTTWDGYVGLMYPSDYGYTYSDGVDDECYGTVTNCVTNSTKGWIRKGHESESQWTITPYPLYEYNVYYVYSNGEVNAANLPEHSVRPVVYLKSSVKITGGTGQESDPYTIGES